MPAVPGERAERGDEADEGDGLGRAQVDAAEGPGREDDERDEDEARPEPAGAAGDSIRRRTRSALADVPRRVARPHGSIGLSLPAHVWDLRVSGAGGAASPEAVAAMAGTLAHRGPDAEGQHVDGPVGSRPPAALDHRPVARRPASR